MTALARARCGRQSTCTALTFFLPFETRQPTRANFLGLHPIENSLTNTLTTPRAIHGGSPEVKGSGGEAKSGQETTSALRILPLLCILCASALPRIPSQPYCKAVSPMSPSSPIGCTLPAGRFFCTSLHAWLSAVASKGKC